MVAGPVAAACWLFDMLSWVGGNYAGRVISA
jgi:hypothetical protein